MTDRHTLNINTATKMILDMDYVAPEIAEEHASIIARKILSMGAAHACDVAAEHGAGEPGYDYTIEDDEEDSQTAHLRARSRKHGR